MELRYCTSETRNSWFIELPDNDWSTTGDDADAVYYWSVKDFTKPHILDNCVIYKTEDDGIDHWRSYSKISNCLISRMYDKGISTGYGSQVTVIRSVFARDQRGVSPSFGSHVKIYQSDFYNCNIPLWAYNYSSGELHNCVLANHSTDYNDHGYPSWYFNHCISDSDPALPGKSNLYGSIGMTDPSQWDFTLSAGSPAIDTGDPEMERDPDGSVADIGAFPYIPGGAGKLVINEIYYHPPASQGLESQYEFIELINASGQTLDVGNYRLTNAVDFVFPENIIVDPGGLILVVSDPVTYKDLDVPVFAWKSSGKLSNKGESIQLINQRGELNDEVTYNDSDPWPAQADGLGYSLSLTDPYSDNSNPDNWLPSYIYGGTPGRKNLQPDWSKLKINETFRAAANSIGQTSTDNSWLEIYNGTDVSINIGGLFISDDSADPGKWQINRTHPDKTQVQAKSFVLLKFVENPGTSSPLLLPDTLVKSQGPVILSRLNWDGTYTRIDNVTFDPTENTHSTGRYPDGASNILDFSSPSPGAPNAVGATHMISMRQMKAGDYLPVVVRLKAGEQINPDAVNETVSLQADGAALDHNQVALVRGVGSISTKVSGNGDFVLNLPQWDDSLRVKITSFRPMKCNFDPIEYDEIWTGEKDVIIDRDFEISIGRTITIMPGTRVLIAEDANIEVLGAIKAMGTPGNPIIFMPLSWDSQWGGIQFGSYAGASEFNNCFFVGGAGDKSVNLGHSESQAVISSSGAQITLNNCFFLDNSGKAVYGQHAVLKFDGTIISRCDAGIESYDGNVSLDNSAILFIPNEAQTTSGDKEHDGFYIYKAQGSDGSTARITHSLIGFVTDDAVDMLPETLVNASWLTITGTGDKGVSVLGSSLIADHLVVYQCAKGIAAKEASNVTIDQSTFYRNNYALQAYSNNPSIGYASLSLSNSILSSSVANDFYQGDGSTLTVSYSLSDAQLPAGTGNLFGDPQFTDPVNGDFTLQPASPAINQGDPAHLPDPDGSRVDMGAYHYNYGSINNLIISEIHYHPKDIFADYEFVELYNPSVATIDIGNYSVTGSVSFTFPAGTELLPLSYIIIAKDAIIFQNQGFPVYQWDSGGSLPDAGGTVEITTGTGIILDQVNYQAGGYWPSWPAGGGPSLELINPERDNGSGTSWRSSHYINGTPGHPNLTAPQEGIVINEVLARNGTTYPDEYGNYVDWVELYNASYHLVDLSGLFLSKYADNPGRFEIPASGPDSMLIAPGGYFVFWLDEHPERGLHHASFLIPGDGSWIGLSKFNDQSFTVMDSLTYPPITTDLSYGRTPDGGQDFEIFGSPTPNAPNRVPRSKINGLYINELMARNSSTYLNNINEYDDWLELYNSTDQPIDVGGLYLSDHRNNLVLWQIPETHPDSTTIGPKGFMVFYPTTKIHDGIRHVDFQLAGTGEFVALSQHVQGEIVILDSVTYPAITSDLSYGRVQDGAPSWMIFNNPTPDSSNNEASGIDDPVRTNVDISVYPNPVKEHLTILIDPGREHLKQVEIRDLQGRVIVKWLITKPASGNRLRLFWDPISGGDQKPGLVFVIVVTDQSVHFQRVMIND
ncbi:MAG: lamin tail domain-containing protein [Bacteroidales bacterium]|nr:lamin tail domain-containing protein [Bacteroidales bacterium]